MRRPPEQPAQYAAGAAQYPQAVLDWLEGAPVDLLCQRSVQLWHALHEELSAIVGISGFVALYNRCIVLCAEAAPWLEPISVRAASLLNFQSLGSTLARRTLVEAQQASCLLFRHFYELLLLLIGAALTDGVLDAAWRDRLARPHLPFPKS